MPWNSEWLNQNSTRAYPFREDSLLTDTTVGVRIPSNLFVDLCLVVPAGYEEQFYLRTLTFSGSTLLFTLAATSTYPAGLDIASVSVDISAHTTNQSYPIVGQNDLDDIRGRVALGDLSELAVQLPQGAYVFATNSTLFEMRTMRPDLRTVRSLKVIKADGTSGDPLYGIVELAEGLNIRFTYVPAAGPLPHGIRVDCLETDLEEPCTCETARTRPDPIRSINGVVADLAGNLVLEAPEGCLVLAGGGNKITLTDKCSKPCCGCPELKFLTQQLEIMKTSITNLNAKAEQIRAAEEDFRNNVLATLGAGI